MTVDRDFPKKCLGSADFRDRRVWEGPYIILDCWEGLRKVRISHGENCRFRCGAGKNLTQQNAIERWWRNGILQAMRRLHRASCRRDYIHRHDDYLRMIHSLQHIIRSAQSGSGIHIDYVGIRYTGPDLTLQNMTVICLHIVADNNQEQRLTRLWHFFMRRSVLGVSPRAQRQELAIVTY